MKRTTAEFPQIVKSREESSNRILIATATLGLVRIEWAVARWSLIIPCNWAAGSIQLGMNSVFPMGFLVAEAQNVAVAKALAENFEWLFLHEDDVILPADALVKFNQYMRKPTTPLVSGLYYTRSEPAEPILYRGRGNSFFGDWKMGEKVWVDGVPTGCLLVHTSVLRVLWDESETYQASYGQTVRRVFESPRTAVYDPETGWPVATAIGTSDLSFCDKIIKGKVLERAGWKKAAKKRYPFLVDTGIRCGHIERTTGVVYGLNGRILR